MSIRKYQHIAQPFVSPPAAPAAAPWGWQSERSSVPPPARSVVSRDATPLFPPASPPVVPWGFETQERRLKVRWTAIATESAFSVPPAPAAVAWGWQAERIVSATLARTLVHDEQSSSSPLFVAPPPPAPSPQGWQAEMQAGLLPVQRRFRQEATDIWIPASPSPPPVNFGWQAERAVIGNAGRLPRREDHLPVLPAALSAAPWGWQAEIAAPRRPLANRAFETPLHLAFAIPPTPPLGWEAERCRFPTALPGRWERVPEILFPVPAPPPPPPPSNLTPDFIFVEPPRPLVFVEPVRELVFVGQPS